MVAFCYCAFATVDDLILSSIKKTKASRVTVLSEVLYCMFIIKQMRKTLQIVGTCPRFIIVQIDQTALNSLGFGAGNGSAAR